MHLQQMPCPDCGTSRIGNRRAACRSCNRFTQAVIRLTARLLRTTHPIAYDHARAKAEHDVYADRFATQEGIHK